jgi:hypothetical protein
MLRFAPLVLAFGVSAALAQDDELARCAAITDAPARLACFDALSTTATATPAPAATATAAPDPADRFGAESLPQRRAQEATAGQIESRLSGRFEGWDRNTEFVLENGQVWRCSDCRAVYHRAESPKVTIRRSFTGVYWLRVEGLNQQAKVRRVR